MHMLPEATTKLFLLLPIFSFVPILPPIAWRWLAMTVFDVLFLVQMIKDYYAQDETEDAQNQDRD